MQLADDGIAAQATAELDILAFEEWWKRVQVLIVRADTVIFVLSPDAVRPGTVALREVAFATSLNKRLAPIVFRPVEDKSVPEALAELNFIFFNDAARFEQSADQLADSGAWPSSSETSQKKGRVTALAELATVERLRGEWDAALRLSVYAARQAIPLNPRRIRSIVNARRTRCRGLAIELATLVGRAAPRIGGVRRLQPGWVAHRHGVRGQESAYLGCREWQVNRWSILWA